MIENVYSNICLELMKSSQQSIKLKLKFCFVAEMEGSRNFRFQGWKRFFYSLDFLNVYERAAVNLKLSFKSWTLKYKFKFCSPFWSTHQTFDVYEKNVCFDIEPGKFKIIPDSIADVFSNALFIGKSIDAL